MSKLKIAVILGSTRDSRWGEVPARWILEQASKRDEFDVELVDLKDFDLPLFNEAASNLWAPSQDPRAVAWQKKIGEFDGYIFVVAEYNHSITGALKNALDQAYVEWMRKPAGYMAYGSMGGARAVEHLRMINVELHMVPLHGAVHIGGADFFKVFPMAGNQPIASIEENILPAAKNLFDELVWWGEATKAARDKTTA
ncbi:MAG: FMN reductase [Mesorhizobium amorphae]|nr:MAG: FMN reductase [Mesorhizobium amorphae]